MVTGSKFQGVTELTWPIKETLFSGKIGSVPSNFLFLNSAYTTFLINYRRGGGCREVQIVFAMPHNVEGCDSCERASARLPPFSFIDKRLITTVIEGGSSVFGSSWSAERCVTLNECFSFSKSSVSCACFLSPAVLGVSLSANMYHQLACVLSLALTVFFLNVSVKYD